MELKSIKVVLAIHSSLLIDAHFVHSETEDPPKLNNSINICLRNPNIILHYALSLNIYEYLKHHQLQCYHNQLKNHTHIRIAQF